MNCFSVSNGEVMVPQNKNCGSTRSNSSQSTDSKRKSSDFNSMSSFNNSSQKGNKLRVFTYKELKIATKNFNQSLLIGEGGFGSVYKGTIRSLEEQEKRFDVAIKQLNRKGMQGHKEWLAEVDILGVVEHPNLVKLIGYCAEDDKYNIQLLLVYEFMSNRSVADHLSPRSARPLSWSMRLRVALETARGLTYLHEEMDFQIIFRDLKTSNILLDEHWNPKLSDFGLARQGPEEGASHVSTAVVGTAGYAAPEYLHTGHLNSKSDVWTYGVVLYELMTGRLPLDRSRPRNEEKLLEWVRPYVSDKKKFHMIMDPRLAGNYCLEEAIKLASIANKCLIRKPKLRPKMSQVLEMVTSIVEKQGCSPDKPAPKVNTEETCSHSRKVKGLALKRTIDYKAGEGRWQFLWHGWSQQTLKAQ